MDQATSSPFVLPRAGELRRRRLTETERNWLAAAIIVIGSLALFAAIYAFEMDRGRWSAALRLVADPAEATARYVALSHFLVAFYFTATSRRMRTAKSWLGFTGLLALGLGFCFAFSKLQATSAWIAGVVFFSYFLIHDFRDQVFFYYVNGDAPPPPRPKQLAPAIAYSPFLLLALFFLVFAPAVSLGLVRVDRISESLAQASGFGRLLFAITPAILLAATAMLFPRFMRNAIRPAAFLRAHRPIYFVFAGSLLLGVAGAIVTGQPYTLVILHVTAWYVFSLRLLQKGAKLPPEEKARAPRKPGLAGWIRATPGGFQVFHLASFALFVAAGLVWAYAFDNSPAVTPLRLVLDPHLFRYWTILHVTVSFASR